MPDLVPEFLMFNRLTITIFVFDDSREQRIPP